jgi:NDP-sugar pyrophosphorylase family protein
MKAVLLAAGQSARMAPITDKTCLPFLGVPLIVHQVKQLKSCGFTELVIVVSQNNKDVITHLCPDSSIVVQTENSGMKGGGISC